MGTFDTHIYRGKKQNIKGEMVRQRTTPIKAGKTTLQSDFKRAGKKKKKGKDKGEIKKEMINEDRLQYEMRKKYI